jgi:AcrR family transcriptional regulator
VNEILKPGRPGGGLPDKRRAILAGAMTMFARDGYTRASLDAIAAEAGVSSRTIYNHFGDKAHLFEAVIEDSTQRIAQAQIILIDRHLGKIVDLEGDLIEFGLDWVALASGKDEPHFALVRQIHAELEHIPAAALKTWQETGPLRVRGELASRLARIADRGDLVLADAGLAAMHLMLLISADSFYQRIRPYSRAEAEGVVAAGVRAFLYGYRQP